MQRNRLNVYMSPETLQEVELLANELDMTKTGVGSLAIKLGMELLKLAKSQKFAELLAKYPETIEDLGRMVEDAKKTE